MTRLMRGRSELPERTALSNKRRNCKTRGIGRQFRQLRELIGGIGAIRGLFRIRLIIANCAGSRRDRPMFLQWRTDTLEASPDDVRRCAAPALESTPLRCPGKGM